MNVVFNGVFADALRFVADSGLAPVAGSGAAALIALLGIVGTLLCAAVTGGSSPGPVRNVFARSNGRRRDESTACRFVVDLLPVARHLVSAIGSPCACRVPTDGPGDDDERASRAPPFTTVPSIRRSLTDRTRHAAVVRASS